MIEGEEGEPNALALLIQGLMDERGLDPRGLAEASGLGPSTIYAYLRGRQRGAQPRTDTFDALARALRIDVAALYAAAERADARGQNRLLQFYNMLPTQAARAEAIEAVRQLAWKYRRT